MPTKISRLCCSSFRQSCRAVYAFRRHSRNSILRIRARRRGERWRHLHLDIAVADGVVADVDVTVDVAVDTVVVEDYNWSATPNCWRQQQQLPYHERLGRMMEDRS